MEKKLNESECNSNWDTMLKMFHGLVATKANKDEFQALIELAANAIMMTPRQREGIVGRCSNVISGNYGNTKKSEHIQKPEAFSQNGKQQ